MKSNRVLCSSSLLFCCLIIISSLSYAQETDDEWHFTLAFPMIWAPDINGTIEGGGDRMNISIPFGDIVESLDVGLLGEFYAQKNKWIYGLKFNYLKTKGESVTDPVLGGVIAPAHKVEDTLQLAVVDALAGYRVHRKVDLYTGVRYISTKMDISIRPEDPGGIISISRDINLIDKSIYDWLIGVTFHQDFNPHWGFKISADAAIAGDNDRDYMLDALLFFLLSKLNNILAGYRYFSIGNDAISNTVAGPVEYAIDFTQQGPTLGWAFTF